MIFKSVSHQSGLRFLFLDEPPPLPVIEQSAKQFAVRGPIEQGLRPSRRRLVTQ